MSPTSPLRHQNQRGSVLEELERFAKALEAASYSSKGTVRSYRNGAAAFLSFLEKRGQSVRELTTALWNDFRDETLERAHRGELSETSAQMVLTGARAYLRFQVREGKLRPEKLPRAVRARREPIQLPPALSHLSQILEQAMEVAYLSETTRPVYRRALRDFLLYLTESEGITDLLDVHREVLTAYRLHLQTKTTNKGAPYSISTQCGVITALRFFFGWLVKTGQLLTDPTLHLKKPRSPQRLPRTLKLKELRRVFDSLPATTMGLRDRALVEILYGTGMRRAELAKLCLSDIDLEQGTIFIRLGKGRKDRMVPMGAHARDSLLDYLDLSRENLLRGKTDALFVGNGGRALTANYITERVKTLGKRAGVKLTPHVLRHSCATHLLKGRADIRQIQRLLGHKSLVTTERYTRVEIEDLKKVIERCHPREKK